jgi:hypothetical protein
MGRLGKHRTISIDTSLVCGEFTPDSYLITLSKMTILAQFFVEHLLNVKGTPEIQKISLK